MNETKTGEIIKEMRIRKGLTQTQLAEILFVSDKAVSKWETGRGFPDVGMLEPLSKALDVTVEELISGRQTKNTNASANMLRSKFLVCPECGNVIIETGDTATACCGRILTPGVPQEPEEADKPQAEEIEENLHLTFPHPMDKGNYISFVAGVMDNGIFLTRLYPEGPAEAEIPQRRTRYVYWYSTSKGFYRMKVKDIKR